MESNRRPTRRRVRACLGGCLLLAAATLGAMAVAAPAEQFNLNEAAHLGVNLRINKHIKIFPDEFCLWIQEDPPPPPWAPLRTITMPVQITSNSAEWSLGLEVERRFPESFRDRGREWTFKLLDMEGEPVCEARLDEKRPLLPGTGEAGTFEFQILIEGLSLPKDKSEPLEFNVRLLGMSTN